MDFRWPDEYLAFRDEVESFIHEWRTPELAAEMREREGAAGPLTREYYKALQEKGWMRMCWPVEMGGEGRDPLYQFILVETMEYWRMPYGNLTFTSVAPSIAQYGNEHQKKTYLPGIWNGELTFAIGYSEPNAGTDLAALRTKGEKVDGGWKVNGQKIWTSLAAHSTHIWLATRTDPDSKRHKGISVLIVNTHAPGVTIRPLKTMSGMSTYETFYDDVFVPDEDVVPPLHGGWTTIMHALNHERVGLSPTSNLARNYDVVVDHYKKTRPEKLRDPVLRRQLAELRVELARHRALAIRNAVTIASGEIKPDAIVT
ncbi:MAG TPA: acyl-CoA dehydrogenase family protein, partial [Myxococcota bacterium]|nr:acyl-CoA dehydrogenase family protein [Myxococcota bacterium]